MGERNAPDTTGRRAAIAVAALLLFGAVAGYTAAQWESPTSDEPLHAAAGYLIRFLGDYRVDVEDPALFGLISSLPQSSADLHADPRDPLLAKILVEHFKQWELSIKMMFRTPRADGQSLYSGVDYINRARLVFTAISVVLGALVARWAYEIAGPAAAVIAAALVALDPNFLAHGPLVKNDVPISMLMLGLMYGVWKLGERATFWRMTWIAVACAMAVTVKFSGLLFGPLLAIALLIRAIDSRDWIVLGRALRSRAARVAFVALFCAGVGLFCWGAIWTVYRWRFSMAPEASARFDRSAFLAGLLTLKPNDQPPAPGRAILWLDDHRLFPHAWLYGLTYTYGSSRQRDAFLMGMRSGTGWWYYFPLAMLFKTPLATLLAAIVLSARFCRLRLRAKPQAADERTRSNRWTMICLWTPILIYGATALRTHLNLGLRHVLPLYPFIFILIATALSRWMASARQTVRVIAAIVVIGAAGESLLAWPHEISFFNLAAGGSRGGMRLLSDSNLDWGQDLPLLADWHQQHRDVPLYLAYFGTADPHYYAIDYLNLPGGYPFSDVPVVTKSIPGVMAISATYLQGVYADGRLDRHLAFLRGQKPREIFGGTIYLYDWNPQAFDDYLAQHPD